MSTWNDDDAFWHEMEAVMFTATRLDAARREIPEVLALAGVSAPCRVLDMPCGPGRHSAALAALGHQVVGVDRTARYLDAARLRAPTATFVQADMRTFERPGAFDLVVNLFSSFGYFPDPDDDRAQLQRFHASLREGGKLLMELNGKETLAKILQPSRAWELDDGTLLIEQVKVLPGWTHTETRWTLVQPDGTRTDQTFVLRQYSGAVLRGLLLRVGFRQVALYGALDGRPYDHEAVRLVVVATR